MFKIVSSGLTLILTLLLRSWGLITGKFAVCLDYHLARVSLSMQAPVMLHWSEPWGSGICRFVHLKAFLQGRSLTQHTCARVNLCTYRCRDVHDYLNTRMTAKRQLIPKCFSLWNLLHYFIILSSVSVRKREACPPLKISWSVLTVVNNYLLRRMFGFLHVNACHVKLMVDMPEGLPSMNCDHLYWEKKPWLKGGSGSVTIIEAG